MEQLVIVGGSAAGARAAHAAVAAGFAGSIEVLSRDPDAPYYRPGVSKQLLQGTWAPERAAQPVPTADTVTWHKGVSAVGLDVGVSDGVAVGVSVVVAVGVSLGVDVTVAVGVSVGVVVGVAVTVTVGVSDGVEVGVALGGAATQLEASQ